MLMKIVIATVKRCLDFHSGRNLITLYKFGERQPDPEAPNGEYFDEGGNLFFRFDSRFDAHNILFEERFEDVNGNGVLDEGEDLDSDGRLDVPNFVDTEACIGLDGIEYNQCVADNLVNFYDRQANRLYLKPIWPLEQQCTYAVVLTKRVTGEDGLAIQSPFPYVNPQSQTSDVSGVEPLLSRYSLGTDDVAFAWTFTTGSMTQDIEEVARDFMVLECSLSWVPFPVSGFHPYTRSEMGAVTGVDVDDSVADDYALPGACVASSFTWLWGPNGMSEWLANMCALEADLASVDQTFGGTFKAPNLLNEGWYSHWKIIRLDNDEIWELSPLLAKLNMAKQMFRFGVHFLKNSTLPARKVIPKVPHSVNPSLSLCMRTVMVVREMRFLCIWVVTMRWDMRCVVSILMDMGSHDGVKIL